MTLGDRVARSNARINESQMTKAEAMAMFADRQGLPARRFRVEGAVGGNSRLLSSSQPASNTASAVQASQAKYGGRIVKVFGAADWWTSKASGLPSCTRCGVEHGKPCVNKKRAVVRPHAVRYETPIDVAVLRVFMLDPIGKYAGKALAAAGVGAIGKVNAAIKRLLSAGKLRKVGREHALADALVSDAVAATAKGRATMEALIAQVTA